MAAGQNQTGSRNSDITSILEAEIFDLKHSHGDQEMAFYSGDGSMVLDHELCVLNGDLNYRIDTMSRETVLKMLNSQNISKLLERDQLLVSRRRSPAFVLRAFHEAPIRFLPTYKYDVGTNQYDTSDKRRAPAWCDRIMYRATEDCLQFDYGRHELSVSDHRPVTATFRFQIMKVNEASISLVRERSREAYRAAKSALARNMK